MDLALIKKINIIFGVIISVILLIAVISNIIKKNKENIKLAKKKDEFFEKNFAKIWIVLVIIAVFTRLFQIGSLLNGLHVDEAGMGYDAYCIANFGVDRFLNKLPVYMINFGGGQSALYTYLAAIFVKFFGLNIIAIRMPAALISIIAIIIGSVLMNKYCGKKSSLFFMAFMIICPWHIMQSRFGLDCNLLSSMIIFDFFALLSSKKWYHYIYTGILFGVSLYTYALSYLIIPIILFLTLIYMLYTNRIKFRNIILMGIPIAILALPLILFLLVNNGYLEQIDGFITIPKIYNYRAGEIGIGNIKENVQNIFKIFTADKFIYNSIPAFGTIYLCSIPLMIVGIVIECINSIKNIKNKQFKLGTIMLFLFIANLIVIALTPTNVNKVNSIYISAIYFIYGAIKYVYHNFRNGFLAIVLIYAIMSIMFFTYYFKYYKTDNPNINLVNNQLIELYEKIDEINKDNSKNVYMELNVTQPWIYRLFSLPISPYDLQEQKHEDTVDYWTNMISYGIYYWGLPEEINYDSIYVIKEESNEDLVLDLTENGYQKEEYERYLIMYKSE